MFFPDNSTCRSHRKPSSTKGGNHGGNIDGEVEGREGAAGQGGCGKARSRRCPSWQTSTLQRTRRLYGSARPAWKPGAQSRVFPRWNSVLPGPTTGLRARRRKAGPHRRCGCIWRRPPRYGPGWGDGTPSYVILSGGPGPVQRASLRERRQSPLPWRFESLRPRRNPSFGLLSS